ncbi:flagellar hook protein FlgE [Bdellovibrio svalbardensis]|uniref:Flagellar hook protein FlgE n=1 Tax=Bdellovibrio svalbardensis TaxID=2972972 RepID=A0ABT6DEV0_9BACT|nr:flagellar hook protein FlgE [Bdellovibrio svalbardensis]MDG0815365.1 flagellar hook protein FlgE [Bdellovibrio svalbardensis]
MGILSSLYTGVSGMTAQGEALGVIGDNIANANTIGFKASRAEFQDIISKSLKGVLGGNQIGRGVKIGAVNPILTQGNVDATEKVTDLAISGDGYFKVKGSDGESYTRDGSFHFDREGFLVTNDNQKVQGFSTDDKGNILNKMSDIKFPRALIPAKASKEVKLDLNLDSRMEATKKFDIKDPYSTSHYSTGVEVYDSQGNKHLLSMFFNKTADRQWEYKGVVDGKEVTGGTDGALSEVCAGKLEFTVDGKLNKQTMTSSNFNFKGGALQDQQIKINFGDAIADGGKGLDGTKQYGKNSDLISWHQDGASAGTITSLSFNDEGILTAVYSNGQAQDLAQIALAKFENPEAMFKVGNNRLKESRDSGSASVGAPGAAGRGKLFAKSLERSTVDLATEFVNMIQNQRGFQANAKTITTTDELLNEVIQLKR